MIRSFRGSIERTVARLGSANDGFEDVQFRLDVSASRGLLMARFTVPILFHAWT